SVAQAIQRGQQLVNLPVLAAIVFSFSLAAFVALFSVWLAALLAAAGFSAGWLWWSYSVPRWRSWAHLRGVNADELQRHAVAAKLVWPKGSFFEKTEFRSHTR